MRFEKNYTLEDGRILVLRNAYKEDAQRLLDYLKIVMAETKFLMREPEEINLTVEEETDFIQKQIESEKDFMLLGEIDGEHVGNCSINSLGNYKRYAHRCSVSIALYQKYCGMGIGRKMLTTALELAKNIGYEQAELEVSVENTHAICLYKNLGFEIYGTQKNNMKYKDGTYCDMLLMMKFLE